MIIGLDVGGTHTDVVLLGDEGLHKQTKVPTDPTNLFDTVVKGLDAVMQDTEPGNIERLVLSTTLTTNAIIQNKIPQVGMIVTGGPGINPECHRIGEHYYAVGGTIDHRGREIDPVNTAEIKSFSKKMKSAGIAHVGVVGKFSTRNSNHEMQILAVLRDDFDVVFLGHQVSGELNFPRRIATTYLNAAVFPIHRDFFQAIERSLTAKGLNVPIRILKADGGSVHFKSSIDFPVQTILSGPAASVMGATAFAGKERETLVLDIGGTTTDMAVLVNGIPLLDPAGIGIGPYRTLIRSLETHSVGIGGDSEVSVVDGTIRIGPERKGPALAHGGPVPTPTDALFVMGKIDNGNRNAAVKGFKPIALEMGLSVKAAAKQVFDYTCKMILLEAGGMIARINGKPVYTVHEMLEGHQVRPRELLVLGGPAPYFAECITDLSDFDVRVVPRWEVANAIGAGLSRTTSEVVLYADTERNLATAPEEHFSRRVNKTFSKKDAIALAFDLLKAKALSKGANPDYLEMEVVEDLEFNMVRGFFTTGKNIRVKVQVKPGLIHGYDEMVRNIISSDITGACNAVGKT
ncbi:MAG: hydantoinase/oxoprolinase family protein [Desulfobacterales bacterium]